MISYIIDMYQLARNLLPHFLQRKAFLGWITADDFFWVTATGETWGTGDASRHLAWIRALMAPLSSLNITFMTNVNDIRYRLNLTGQVIYLEHWLNDLFDNNLRRIYITDGDATSPLFLFNKADTQEPVTIYNKSEAQPPVYLTNRVESEGQVDFIIHIPFEIATSQATLVPKLKSATNIYKPAGRRYSIQDTLGGDVWTE
jgi:hypothetical protein